MLEYLWDVVFSGLILFFITLILAYFYGISTYSFWKKLDIPYIKPKYPFLGTSYETAFSLKPTHLKQLEYYEHFKGKKYGGIYAFTHPVLFIKDPDLIESVLIKDFTSFYNRGTSSDPNFDPLSANLVFLEDTNWKILRQKLSPVFSSGKLRGMLPQLIECAEKLNKFVEKFEDNNEPFEIKQIMSKFSIDIIASCAFGLNINTLDNPDSIFVKLGQKFFQPCWRNRLKQTLTSQYPELLRYLGWKSLPQRLETFFIRLVKDTISYREQNNIVRNDFLQLLMELRKQDMEKLNNGEIGDEKTMIMDETLITSNAFAFFVAGFDTAASTLSYCMFELSRNPDIQEEAYQHILEVLENHDGQLTYDAIKEMTLISQIFAETLRMYPPGVEVRRRVTRSSVIPETTITLPKGLRVAIPLYSLQNDPNYFPEPEKFIPERFSKENRGSIRKGTYLPFGDGPRMCIGKRFAKLEMRVALIKLLLNYKFTLNQKTITPLVYDSTSFMLVPIGGLWINVQKRS